MIEKWEEKETSLVAISYHRISWTVDSSLFQMLSSIQTHMQCAHIQSSNFWGQNSSAWQCVWKLCKARPEAAGPLGLPQFPMH